MPDPVNTITTPTPAVPNGVPDIPAGTQLGGTGTVENNAAAPINPLQPELQQPVHTQVLPASAETTQPANPQGHVYANPYAGKDDKESVDKSNSYIHTSIQHLTTELGVSEDVFDSVIAKALEHGDLNLINTEALGNLTPEQKQRVTQLGTAAVQEIQHNIQRATSEVHTIAGGEEQWNTAVNAFNANAPEDAQGYASYLADNGKLKQAAEYVLNYNTQGGYVTQEQQAPLQGGTGNTAVTGISAAEYSREIGKIEREAGNRSFGSPENAAKIADLDARRTLGRSQGK